jgi:hypothetical protein
MAILLLTIPVQAKDSAFQIVDWPTTDNPVNEMFRVRRERRLVHSGCKSHPETGSFRPVAIGAAGEVTMLLKPPVEEGRKATLQACRP